MAKRIKRVFSNGDQVIHIWANQSQSDARCRNVFFEGKSVYSYGRHYELGRLVEFNGVKLALINDRGYSVTTSGHISSAWHAVSHMFRLKMEGISENRENIETALLREQDRLISMFFDHFNRRAFYSGALDSSYDFWSYEMNAYREFNVLTEALGFEHLALDVDTAFFDLAKDHVRACHARQAELNSPEMLAKREAKALKRNADAIKKWRDGGQSTNSIRNLKPMILRVNGDKVQTSRGAEVPLDHALRLLKLVETRKAKTGERVGHFKLDQIDGEMVKIGCHIINVNEARSVLAPLIQASTAA